MNASRGRTWARNILLGLIAFAFIVLFGQPGGGPSVRPVAELDGEPITREVFEFFRTQNEDLVRQAMGDLDPDTLRNVLDSQTLGGLVRRYLISQEAIELGLWVSDPEVHAEIVATPGFQRAGRFDRELFERYVSRSGLESPRIYTAEVRRDLLMQKFQRTVASPVRLSRATALEEARRQATRLRVRLAVARPEAFLERVEVTEEQARAFAEENAGPIQTLYDERIERFVQPEEVRARHVLFRGEGAQERAAEALARIRAGEEVEALARELSEDPATRDAGGDLGFFPRGRMLPAFEEVAFALVPGEVSEPIETERGVHLILVEEHQPGSERTLEEVAPELARELLAREQAAGAARRAAEAMAERLRAGADFEAAAGKLGLVFETPPAFGWGQAGIPGLEAVPGLKAAAWALGPGRPALPRVFELPGGFALVSLVEREEPDPEELEAALEQTRERLRDELRTRVMTRWYENLRTELQQDGRLVFNPLYPST